MKQSMLQLSKSQQNKDKFARHVKYIDLNQHNSHDIVKGASVLLGFCCDEGVRRNNGKVGAKKGPEHFRKEFFNLNFHHNRIDNKIIYDGGDIVCQGGLLEDAQKKLGVLVKKILDAGGSPIVIGGGHEMAYGHYMGIREAGYSPAILNFDAHFDLRKTLEGNQGSSGTPFRQIKELLDNDRQPFKYYCCGIQRFANSEELFDYAKKEGVQYQMASDINLNPRDMSFIEKIIKEHKEIYLTVCLDVFSSEIAPGVSAPQALGINSLYVLEAIKMLKASGNVVSLDIAELNPSRDLQERTAKLSAHIAAEYLYQPKIINRNE